MISPRSLTQPMARGDGTGRPSDNAESRASPLSPPSSSTIRRPSRWSDDPETTTARPSIASALRERGLLAGDALLDGAKAAAGAADLLIGFAQLARRLATLSFDPATLGRDLLELVLHLLESTLGLAAVLRGDGSRRPRQDQRERRDERCAQARHQPTRGVSSRLAPLISAGCGRPSRSRMVGATSRRAPPLRRLAARGPR